MKTKNILHILMHEYVLDSRVKNETESLQKTGYSVTVFCLTGNNTKKTEIRNNVKIVRHGFGSKKTIKIFSTIVGMFFKAMLQKYKIIHVHDITALPIAFIIAKLKRIPFIYDSHELWAKAEHNTNSKLAIHGAITIEKIIAHKASQIITVSDSIRDHLKISFNNPNVTTIRNIPSYTQKGKYNIFREKHNIPQDTPIFIYQGLFSKSRGVHIILDALLKTDRNMRFKFIFLGFGDFAEEMKKIIKENHLESTAMVLDPVPQEILLQYTKSADIGVHAIANTCLSHDYCLPNKILEFMQAGLAIVCTNLTELSKFINTNHIGLTFENNNPQDLAAKIEQLATDKELLLKYKSEAQKLSKKITWENEAEKLFGIYEKLI
ncbi:glycosyltransferase family 4 protein [Candidatus Margulisiibacteriota bacterium]